MAEAPIDRAAIFADEARIFTPENINTPAGLRAAVSRHYDKELPYRIDKDKQLGAINNAISVIARVDEKAKAAMLEKMTAAARNSDVRELNRLSAQYAELNLKEALAVRAVRKEAGISAGAFSTPAPEGTSIAARHALEAKSHADHAAGIAAKAAGKNLGQMTDGLGNKYSTPATSNLAAIAEVAINPPRSAPASMNMGGRRLGMTGNYDADGFQITPESQDFWQPKPAQQPQQQQFNTGNTADIEARRALQQRQMEERLGATPPAPPVPPAPPQASATPAAPSQKPALGMSRINNEYAINFPEGTTQAQVVAYCDEHNIPHPKELEARTTSKGAQVVSAVYGNEAGTKVLENHGYQQFTPDQMSALDSQQVRDHKIASQHPESFAMVQEARKSGTGVRVLETGSVVIHASAEELTKMGIDPAEVKRDGSGGAIIQKEKVEEWQAKKPAPEPEVHQNKPIVIIEPKPAKAPAAEMPVRNVPEHNPNDIHTQIKESKVTHAVDPKNPAKGSQTAFHNTPEKLAQLEANFKEKGVPTSHGIVDGKKVLVVEGLLSGAHTDKIQGIDETLNNKRASFVAPNAIHSTNPLSHSGKASIVTGALDTLNKAAEGNTTGAALSSAQTGIGVLAELTRSKGLGVVGTVLGGVIEGTEVLDRTGKWDEAGLATGKGVVKGAAISAAMALAPGAIGAATTYGAAALGVEATAAAAAGVSVTAGSAAIITVAATGGAIIGGVAGGYVAGTIIDKKLGVSDGIRDMAHAGVDATLKDAGKTTGMLAKAENGLPLIDKAHNKELAQLIDMNSKEALALSTNPELAKKGVRNFQDPAYLASKLDSAKGQTEYGSGLVSWALHKATGISSADRLIKEGQNGMAEVQLAAYKKSFEKWNTAAPEGSTAVNAMDIALAQARNDDKAMAATNIAKHSASNMEVSAQSISGVTPKNQQMGLA